MSKRQIVCAHCGWEGEHHGRGLCHACYLYWHRHGRSRPLSFPTTCVVCERKLDHRANGAICKRCYMRAWRLGLTAADVYAGAPGIVLQARSDARAS